MLTRRSRRYQTGDTIVEVLIAIAVVGSVLGIAYSIMNRNLIVMRENQERSEAVKYARGQIESLRNLWSTSDGRTALGAVGTSGFCFDDSGAIIPLSGSAPTTNPADDDFSNYYSDEEAEDPDAGCRFAGLYHIGVRRMVLGGNDAYRVYARWDPLRSSSTSQKNEVIMTYRVN